MPDRRCPDCGYRTTADRCPICMTRIPGSAGKQTKTNAAPRQTGTYTPPKYTPPRQPRTPARTRNAGKRVGLISVVMVFLAIAAVVFQTAMEYGMWDSYMEPVSQLDEMIAQLESMDTDWPVSMQTDAAPEPEAWAGDLPQIEETVIWEESGVTVTASGMELVWTNPAVSLTVENETGHDIVVSSFSVAVNGFVLEYSNFYCAVGDGETVTEELCLYAEDLRTAGIDTIANVGLSLYSYDPDTYETVGESEWILLETSDADYEQTFDFEGTEILNESGLRVVYLDAEVENGDAQVRFYVENISDRALDVWSDELRLNGQSVEDGWLYAGLQPGNRTVCTVDVYGVSDLGVESMDDLKEMTIVFQVEDMESWEAVLDGKQITFELGENE